MIDGTLPANLISSNEWPYAKLPPLAPRQCVLRTASGFVDLLGESELWLDNIAIQAPYLFDRNEAVAPTAVDRSPKPPPRGEDYLEFEPAAPGPYDTDYEAAAPYDFAYAPLSAYAPYDDSYAPLSAYAPYDAYDSYAPFPAASFYDYSASAPGPYDSYDFPPLGPRQYEGRAAYPDYEEAPGPGSSFDSASTDPARRTALTGPLIAAYDGYDPFSFVPEPTTAPSPRQVWMTDVIMSGGASHVTTDSASVFASGAFGDPRRHAADASARGMPSHADCALVTWALLHPNRTCTLASCDELPAASCHTQGTLRKANSLIHQT